MPAIKSCDADKDKSYTNLQNMVGAQAAMTLEMWACVTRLREKHSMMIKAVKQALSGSDSVSLDQAVATILQDTKGCRDIVADELAIGMKDCIRVSAAMFNKLTIARRKLVVKGLGESKGAKDRLEECQPSNEFLFGNDLKELAKAMKEETQFKGRASYGDSSSSFFQKKSKQYGQDGFRKKQGQLKGGKGPHKGNAAVKKEKE